MSNFHKLTVSNITPVTADAVSIEFQVPSDLTGEYTYKAGQYLTLKTTIKGEEVRRAYSIWTAPADNKLAVLVKKIQNGLFSSYANESLKVGEEIDVMIPQGNFLPNSKNSVYFAAGSGITPILSMIKDKLLHSKDEVTLFYSNRNKTSVIFMEELEKLNQEYSNFHLHLLFTKENGIDDLYYGRVNKEKCEKLKEANLLSLNEDGYYLCGPEEMIFATQEFLLENKVEKSKIHFELFTATAPVKEISVDDIEEATVTMVIDDDEFVFSYNPNNQESMLEAGIENGLDLPFSCKGGVCCTCKAKIMSGTAKMGINYALTDEEVEEGYILTCQSHPTSESITVSFDE